MKKLRHCHHMYCSRRRRKIYLLLVILVHLLLRWSTTENYFFQWFIDREYFVVPNLWWLISLAFDWWRHFYVWYTRPVPTCCTKCPVTHCNRYGVTYSYLCSILLLLRVQRFGAVWSIYTVSNSKTLWQKCIHFQKSFTFSFHIKILCLYVLFLKHRVKL